MPKWQDQRAPNRVVCLTVVCGETCPQSVPSRRKGHLTCGAKHVTMGLAKQV